MKTNDKNTIVLNSPKELNLNFLFPKYSQKDINKIIFLINQINEFSLLHGYQINIRNHAEFLSLKTGEVTNILSILVSAGVIKITDKFKTGIKSNTYKMVQPFKASIENSHPFYIADKSFPLFLKKWIADNYTVKATKASNFKKEVKISKSEIEFINRIKQLEQFIIDNGLTVPSSVLDEPVALCEEPITEIESPAEENNHAKHDEVLPAALTLNEPEIGYLKESDTLYSTINNEDIVISNYSILTNIVGEITPDIQLNIFKQMAVPQNDTSKHIIFINEQILYFDISIIGTDRVCIISEKVEMVA